MKEIQQQAPVDIVELSAGGQLPPGEVVMRTGILESQLSLDYLVRHPRHDLHFVTYMQNGTEIFQLPK